MNSAIGPFQVRRLLGRGSYGEVYEADGGLAVKVMRPDRQTPQQSARFRSEAAALAAVEHPAVMALKAPLAELPDGTLYFAMELVTGGSLADLVARGGYSGRQLLDIAAALADGLDCLHRAGVLHRDLAPSNILLDHELRPRIADLGMARTGQEGPTPDFWFAHGDPEYAAPERLFHIESGEMGDCYSLGAVLYALYTRNNLFRLSELSFLYNLYTRQIEQFFRNCLQHGLPCPRVDFRAVYEHYVARAPELCFVPAVPVDPPVRQGIEEVLSDLLQPDSWRRLQRHESLSGVKERLSELGEVA